MEEKHTVRHFFRGLIGFILTILILIVGLAFCLGDSLKNSILDVDSLSEFASKNDMYENATDIAIEYLVEHSKDFGVSGQTIRDVVPKDILNDTAEKVVDSLEKGEDIDLSYLKSECNEYASIVCEAVVTETLEKVKANEGILDETVAAAFEQAEAFADDYLDVDVKKVLMDTLQEAYQDTKLKVTSMNIDEVRNTMKKGLMKNVLPTFNELFDDNIDEINKKVNDELNDLNDEMQLKEVFQEFEDYVDLFHKIVWGLLAVVVVLAILEFVLYHKELYRACRNVGIALLISGLIITILLVCIKSFTGDLLREEAKEIGVAGELLSDYLECTFIIPFAESRTGATVFIIVGIVMIIAAIVWKIIRKKNKTCLPDEDGMVWNGPNPSNGMNPASGMNPSNGMNPASGMNQPNGMNQPDEMNQPGILK